MNNNSTGEKIILFFVAIGIFAFLAMLAGVFKSEPKCIEPGCNNDRASGSSYCHLHKSYSGRSSSYSGTSTSNKTSETTTKSYSSGSSSSGSSSGSSHSSGSSNKGTTKSNSYDSYDDGYDGIYMNDDYDWDRYYSDSDYADGVDDAMDELDEDW